MKISNLSAAFVAALVLSACGGGGGDSSPAPTTVPVVVVTPTPVVITVTCPNGSTVTSATDCPTVGTAPVALQGSVMSPTALDQGITLQFNGALNPSTVMVMLKQGDLILGSTRTITGGDKDVTFKPNVRLAYGQAYTVLITATDTLGRAVSVTFSFTTSAMVCSSNAVFSNPVPFSAVYQACIASIGVQTLITPSLNTMTDVSCVPTVGIALSASCRNYIANGTILLADTSIVANNHALMWMAYIGMDTKSNLVLLDTTTVMPIGTMVLPGSLLWDIGNPTGAAISENVGYLSSNGLAVNSNQQISWNGSVLVAKCYTNCPI